LARVGWVTARWACMPRRIPGRRRAPPASSGRKPFVLPNLEAIPIWCTQKLSVRWTRTGLAAAQQV
ncbi:MAG TPA: hypothetical protein VJS65_10525, partial [Verrucomicrobiae bacterium]|nr:hypothetical protein [Verrucomicrobiae bacterium]